MHRLQQANFQKCIDTLEDFVYATPSSDFDNTLQEKKIQAEQSLKQMKELFIYSSDDDHFTETLSTCSSCAAGTCQQDTN